MNAECRTAQVAGSLVGRGCPPTFCIAHCTQEEIAQLVGASRSTRHSPNSPAAAGSASMTRRCGSATLNAAPARRHSRRAVVERPPSTCCGSWPAGCAAPTATWTPLVVGAARVSFVRAAPGPGVIPPGGSGEGRATDVVHHPRRWPRTISFADGGHQRLVDVRGTEPLARWQDAQPANVFG